LSCANSVVACLLEGAVEAGSDEAEADEVVEVPGLEGGVLAVVGEAQQLARARSEAAGVPEVAEGGQREQRRGGAPALGAERAELAEVGLLPGVVGDAAGRTEQERGADEVCGEVALALDAELRDDDALREVLLALGADLQLALVVLEPGLREGAQQGGRVVAGPGGLGVDVEIAGLALVGVELVGDVALRIRDDVVRQEAAADGVELLATFAAETEWEQEFISVTAGDVLLDLHGQEAVVLAGEGGVDGVSPGDELVEAEGEQRSAVDLMAIAGHEGRGDGGLAALGDGAGQTGEVVGGAAWSADGARLLANEAPVPQANAEGRLDPGSNGIGGEGLVIIGNGAGVNLPAKPVDQVRVVEVELGGDPAQGLADDAARLDGRAEDEGGDGGDRAALVVPVTVAGKRG
jgi:hypothetical protein